MLLFQESLEQGPENVPELQLSAQEITKRYQGLVARWIERRIPNLLRRRFDSCRGLMSVFTPEQRKKHAEDTILRALRDHGPLDRLALARATRLQGASETAALKRLCRRGVVKQTGTGFPYIFSLAH